MTIENPCRPIELEAPQDDCGVYAVYSPSGAAFEETFTGIEQLVNRGEHSNGIVTLNQDGTFFVQKFLGKPDRDLYDDQDGVRCAIGHDRYTTSKETNVENAQPMCAGFDSEDNKNWRIALGHNGNLVINQDQLRNQPLGTSDTAYLAQLIVEAEGKTWLEKLRNSLPQVNGSYSCTMLTPDGIWAFRDPRGNRPLWVGEYEDGTIIVSSETIELKERKGLIGYTPVAPGEGIFINQGGDVERHQLCTPQERAFCAIETIYLQHHKSNSEEDGNPENNEHRVALGKRLAGEDESLKELTSEQRAHSRVVAIPNGGKPYAVGFAEGSGIENSELLLKILEGRSYITPDGDHGGFATRKLEIIQDTLEKVAESGITDVYLTDDSLIRGSQILPAVRLLQEAFDSKGMIVKIHVRICAPVIHNRCDLGIVIRENELFYNKLPQILLDAGQTPSKNPDEHLDQVLEYMGIASLKHISTVGLVETLSGEKVTDEMGTLGQAYCALGYCISCMQVGEHPKQATEWF